MPDFDLFISYRRRDAERALPLVAALRERGVSVWLDQHAIGDFAPITTEIRQGLAQSKALLAWYSEAYPTSRPCQMELTAALLAAHREGDSRRRILVINPEPTSTHIEPVELRDAQYAVAPSDAAESSALAGRIAAHIAALPGPLGGILPIVPPVQYGLTLTGASRFVGRLPDLWRIHSALHASESAIISGTSAPGLAIVSGFGGIGKSLLAEEYALRFGAAYPGGIFWLRAHGHDAPGESPVTDTEAVRLDQFMAMATELGIADRDPLHVRFQLRATLSQTREPFLWIVDDLASGLDADAVKAWLAPAPQGQTLVTTRSREYTNIGHEQSSVRLGVMTPAEAYDLLCGRRMPVGATEDAAARGITQDLGYHALAVDVAGAALAAHTGLTSFAEFRRDLAHPREDELELAADLTGVLPSGHEPSVAATILRSVRHLPEEGRDVLRMAALLAVAPIPPALVASTFGHVDNLAERDAKRRAIHGLDQVGRASLAERGDGDGAMVHALVSRTMRFRDDRRERREALRAAVVAALLPLTREIVSRNSGGAPPEVQHARALIDLGDLWDLDTLVLAGWVATHDHQRGLSAMARRMEERVLEARRRVQGEDHPETLTSMSNLAVILDAQGDFAGARRLHEQALEARRRTMGEDHSETLTSMNNLGAALLGQGDLVGARGWLERAVEALLRVQGDDHPDTLSSMSNLAEIQAAQGDSAGARGLLVRVIEAQSRTLGADHPDTLTSVNNLAMMLGEQGDLAGARAWLERALDARQRVQGEDHPETLSAMSNLAEMLRAQGDLVGARGALERVLETRWRVQGKDHPQTLASMNELAFTLWAQRDLAGARRLHEQALEARRRALGEDHSETLTSMNNLAEVLAAQGDLAGARAWLERALEARQRVQGEDHLHTLTSMNNLAEFLWAQGDVASARKLHERVLEAVRRVLGEDHPNTLRSMNNLAMTLAAQGDLGGARGWQERVLEARRRVQGEDHPDTLASMHYLATTLAAQGDLPGARTWLERAVETRRRVLGEDHPDTMTSMHNLAWTLGTQGDLAGARGLQERVLEARRRVLGEDHPDTRFSANNLAATLQAQRDQSSEPG